MDNDFFTTTSTAGLVIAAFFLFVMVAVIVICGIYLVRAVKEQIRYNTTVLPTLDLEGKVDENGELDINAPLEETSAFDVDSVFGVDENDGFESDEWFAKIREEEGRYSAEDIEDSDSTEISINDLVNDDEEVKQNPRKNPGLPEL